MCAVLEAALTRIRVLNCARSLQHRLQDEDEDEDDEEVGPLP